jgi:hypothetical protein
MRITKKLLREMPDNINETTGKKKWILDYNPYYGYNIIEQVNEAGAVRDISERMSTQKMYCFLRGVQLARSEKI